jgi:DNA-binding transcriptional ArsR family regulator
MDHDLLEALHALTDPTRLRVIGRLAAGPAGEADLGRELDLAPGLVRHHLERLTDVGLVRRDVAGSTARYALRVDALNDVARRLAQLRSGPAGGPPAPGIGPAGEAVPSDVAKVLRGFFAADRLTSIPVNGPKRMTVLRYLRDRVFTEDRPYPEKEVNQRLALFHPDVAALRRYMIDSGLLTRDAGWYRRPTPSSIDDAGAAAKSVPGSSSDPS